MAKKKNTSADCKAKTIQILKREGKIEENEAFVSQILDDINDMGFDLAADKSNLADIIREARKKAQDILDYKKSLEIQNKLLKTGYDAELTSTKNRSEFFVKVSAGLNKAGKAVKKSMGSLMEVINGEHATVIHQDFGEHLEYALKAENQRSIYQAVDALNKGQQVANGPLREVARAVQKFNHYIVESLKKSGIAVNERLDYIARQVHSAEKMIKEDYKPWRDFIITKLDPAKTFGNRNDDEIEEMLKEAFFDITSGGHSKQGSSTLGKARSFHFKDGANLYDYHARFGEGNIVDVMLKTAQSAARAQARFQFFGSNPEEMWKSLENKAAALYREEGDIKGLHEFETGSAARERLRLKEQFVTGLHGVGGKGLIAQSMENLTRWQAVTKLGSAYFSTFTDVAFNTANYMAKTGEGFVSSLAKSVEVWTSNFPKNSEFRTRVALLYSINQDFDTMRFETGMDGSLTGRFTRITNAALKANFLDFSTKMNRSTSAFMFGEHIASQTSKGFNDLNVRLRGEMEAFGITAMDWDEMRKAAKDSYHGVEVLSPGKLENLDVRRKFNALIGHNAKFGAISPDQYLKAMLTFGLDPNSATAAAVKMIMQFKSYSLQVIRSGKEIMRSNPNIDNDKFWKVVGDVDNAKIFGCLVMLGWAGSYTGQVLNSWAKGRNHEFNKENAIDAFERGVMPLGASYLFAVMKGEYGQFGRNILKDAAGPTLSEISEFVDLASNPSSKHALRLARRNAPMANAPGVAPLIDKLFYNSWMESVNPGYRRRKYERDKKAGREDFFGL